MHRSSISSRGAVRPFAAGSAVLLAVTVLSACDSTNDRTDGSEAPGPSGLVVIITPPADDPYVDAEVDAAEAKAEELGYETSVESHGDDPNRQSRLIDAAISESAVAIILDNAGADASIGPVQKAADAGIPVFLIESELNVDDIATAEILSDNAQGAQLGARAFVDALGGEGAYVELTGDASDTSAGVRSSGYQDVISQQPNMELVARETANWDQQEAFTRMRSIIRRNPDIDGVIAGNDAMALGAVAALRAARMTDVVVVGFDGSPDAITAIKEGALHATVLRPAARIAELAVEGAHELISTGEATQAKRQSLDCELITQENADDYGVFGPA